MVARGNFHSDPASVISDGYSFIADNIDIFFADFA
jgi:hypothetical protein